MRAFLPALVLGAAHLLVAPAVWAQSDSDRVRVHLVADGDAAAEHAFDLDEPLELEPGRYNFWLQSEWRMTPFSGRGLLRSGARSHQSMGGIDRPDLVDAGTVALPPGLGQTRDMVLHLLHAGDYMHGGLRFELLVRRDVGEVGDGVLMPEGPTVAALWHPPSKSYVAISRPFVVAPRATVVAPLEVPSGRSHLMARIGTGFAIERPNVKLQVEIDDGNRSPEVVIPDAVVETSMYTFGFWYDLPVGSAVVSAETANQYVERTVDFVPGAIERVLAALEDKAALEIQWPADTFAEDEAKRVQLGRLRSCTIAGEVLPAKNLSHALFRPLVPGDYEIVLESDAVRYVAGVALAAAELRVFEMLVTPVDIRGTVSAGGEPQEVMVTFVSIDGVRSSVYTNEEGAFHITADGPVERVEIRSLDKELDEELVFRDCLETPIDEPATLHLDVSSPPTGCPEADPSATQLRACSDPSAPGPLARCDNGVGEICVQPW